MKDEQCPCEECICIPICRNRHLEKSIEKCKLLYDYIESNSRRYKPNGLRLTNSTTLDQVNKVFRWGWLYENTL